MDKLTKLKVYSTKYQISIQFWGPGNTNVWIEKDGVPLIDFGNYDFDEAIDKTLEYLDKINPKSDFAKFLLDE